MHKRKTYQKISSNAQHIHGNNNNQAGRDINFFSHLASKPRNIEISPVKDYEHYYYILTTVVFVLLAAIVFYVFHSFGVDPMGGMFFVVFIFSLFIAIVTVISSLDWTFKKFKWGHIKYKDGVFKYDGKEHKFYENIWSVELKRGINGKGKIEFFGVHSKTNRVYSVKLVLMRYNEAKYLHDIFWSGLRNQGEH